MGNATVSNVVKTVAGNKRIVVGKINMSNSYATGGDSLNLESALGLNVIDEVVINPFNGYTLQADLANSKIKAYSSGGTEVVNATDLSSVSTSFIALGR